MSKYTTFEGIQAVKESFYEVIDAEAANDAFPPRPFRVPAKVQSDGFFAIDAEDAACQWAEHRWADYDHPDWMDALVTDPEGGKWRVEVKVEAVPSFSGRAAKVEP